MPRIPAPTDRAARLIARRDLKMARSAHAYVRGSTERFYAWIDSEAGRQLPVGPSAWICGDCHVGNLGPIGHSEGKAVVELRDLDQTVIGNPVHDLVRLALSLAMSARSSDLPGVTTARITEDLVAGYQAAFAGDVPSEKIDDLPSPIRLVMKRAVRRTWGALFEERLGKTKRRIQIGRRFWPLADDEKQAVTQLAESEPVRKLVATLSSRDDDATVRVADAAFWVKGCSSLGLWRAAILVEVRDRSRKGRKRRSVCLLDVKQAVDASAPWADTNHEDLAPAERVVAGARKLAPALGSRMVAASMLDRSVFVRELLPQDLKVELDHISNDDGRALAFYLGMVVGRAHGRQLDAASRRAWYTEIASHRSKNIDAPGWLWSSVIDLVALHERAYLEHCRHYALAAESTMPPDLAEAIVASTIEPERPEQPRAGFTASVASAAGAADAQPDVP